ncbi:MAG TPA: hypothetical protein VEH48_01895 [Candidatus Nitrosopolaris sp.]|nr:hypothetical protein [Candidatus Nitrosopolaris sp.]
MSVSQEIKSGYAAIAKASSDSDRVKAYAEFHRQLDGAKISVDDIEGASRQSGTIFEATKAARDKKVRIKRGTKRLLRGSGIIVVGSYDGDILAADYHRDLENEDLVANKYPGYQKIAVRKIGQALLLGSVNAKSVVNQYHRLQEMLVESGLTETSAPPHHLGYAGGHGLTVGASGMLPTDEVAAELSELLAPELVEGYRRRWVDWKHDEFAGAIDLAAADHVIHPTDAIKTIHELTAYIRSYHDHGLNPH